MQELLLLCDYSITGKVDTMSLKKSFPSLYNLLPAQIIIPLQNSLTVSLPYDASQAASHKPFPDNLPTFRCESAFLAVSCPELYAHRRLLSSYSLRRPDPYHELAAEASQDHDPRQRRRLVQFPLQTKGRSAEGRSTYGVQRNDYQAAQEGFRSS